MAPRSTTTSSADPSTCGSGPSPAAPIRVSRFEDRLLDFEWSFDGKTLACSRQSEVSDAVLITNFR